MTALIVVKFKTYASAQGDAAVTLAKAMAEVNDTTDASMVAVVSAFDLSAVKAAAPGLEVWTQHWIQLVGVLTLVGCTLKPQLVTVLQAPSSTMQSIRSI